MEGEGGEPEAVNSAATGSSAGMMDAEWVQGDRATLLHPEAALPVRPEVRAQSMRRSPSGAGSEAQRRAAKHTRVIWPPQTRRRHHPRRVPLPQAPLVHHCWVHHLLQPQPASLLPGVAVFSHQEGYHHAVAGVVGAHLLPAQAGALQASPWFQRSLQWALCPPVRSP